MNGLELNKIAAAVLIAGIIAMVVGNIADILYQPNKKFVRGYEIETLNVISSPTSHETEKKEELDIAALLSKADAKKGQDETKRCVICHTFTKDGPNKLGANLWGIVGAIRARKKDFAYSQSMLNKGGTWTKEDLLRYLHSPRTFIPGNKMAFAGFSNPQDAANIVAYLDTLK